MKNTEVKELIKIYNEKTHSKILLSVGNELGLNILKIHESMPKNDPHHRYLSEICLRIVFRSTLVMVDTSVKYVIPDATQTGYVVCSPNFCAQDLCSIFMQWKTFQDLLNKRKILFWVIFIDDVNNSSKNNETSQYWQTTSAYFRLINRN